jgi:hypothetical protein
VLRYFAFKETGGEYSDNLTKFLDRFMEKSRKFDEMRIDDLRKDFQNSLTACQMLFEEDEIFADISRGRKRQGVVYYDLLMGSLGNIDGATIRAKRDEIRKVFAELCTSPEFRRLTAGGLQRKTSIARRNKLWDQKLQAVLN